MAQPRTRQPPEGVPPEYVAAAAGILGAQAAGQPPEPPDDEARVALIAAVLLWYDRYVLEARRRRRAALETRLRAISQDRAEVEATLDAEEALDAEFARKQKQRMRDELAVIAALPDPRDRAEKVQALMRRERRIDRSHTEMALARPAAAVAHQELRKTSPLGAFWRLGARERHCPICLFMANRFWPWSVLEEVAPPVHYFCGCSLHGYGEAIANGWLRIEDLPTEPEALALARGVVLDEEAYEEAWLDATGAIAVLAEGFAAWKGWDPNLHPRDNLGQFVETLAEMTPKGLGKNWAVALDPKIRVSRDPDGTYRVTANSRIHKGFRSHVDAAVFAFDRSAKSETPGSVGDSFPGQEGVPKYKDFDAFLKAKGHDPTDAWVANKGASGIEGVATKEELAAENFRLTVAANAASASPDKYVQRTAAPLRKRAKSMAVKAQNAPDIPVGGLPPVEPPVPDFKDGDIVTWNAPEIKGGGKVVGKVVPGVGGHPEHVTVEVTEPDPDGWATKGELLTPHKKILSKGDADPALVQSLGTEAIASELESLPNVSAKVYSSNAGNVVVLKNAGGEYVLNMESGVGGAGAPTSSAKDVASALQAMKAKPVEGPTPLPKTAIENGLTATAIGDVLRWEVAGKGDSHWVVWRKSEDEFSLKAWNPETKDFVEGSSSVTMTKAAAVSQLSVAKVTQHIGKVEKKTGLPVGETFPAAAPKKPPQPDDGWDSFYSGWQLAAKLTDLHGETIAKATAKEKSALKAYTGHMSSDINGQLRHPRGLGKETIEEKIVALDDLFEKAAPFKDDAVLWRGVGGKTKEEYKNAEPGHILRDNGFGSTSTKEDFARGWSNLVLKIRWPKGAKALWAQPGSSHSSEDEVLLPRGVALRVLGKRVEGSSWTIVVEPISGHKG